MRYDNLPFSCLLNEIKKSSFLFPPEKREAVEMIRTTPSQVTRKNTNGRQASRNARIPVFLSPEQKRTHYTAAKRVLSHSVLCCVAFFFLFLIVCVCVLSLLLFWFMFVYFSIYVSYPQNTIRKLPPNCERSIKRILKRMKASLLHNCRRQLTCVGAWMKVRYSTHRLCTFFPFFSTM